MTEQTMTRVDNIEDHMPYVEPPAPPKSDAELFSEEMYEFVDMYDEEAKYHRTNKNWNAANVSEQIKLTLTRIAKAKDPEALASTALRDLAYQMTALRDAATECRRQVMRVRNKRAKAAAEASEKAKADAAAATVQQLREDIQAIEGKPVEGKVVETAEVERYGYDKIEVGSTEDNYMAGTRPVTIRFTKANMTDVEAMTRHDAVVLCAALMKHLKETRPE